MMLTSLIPYIVAIAGVLRHVQAQASDSRPPGRIACSNLTQSFGDNKVANSPLNPKYITSREDYWNARQSIYAPSCVVYPTSAQDISLAIKTIHEAGTRFAVKAGGHNTNDFFSSVDKGVLIDLRYMKEKSYNESTTLATYEPGNNWGDLYDFYEDYGRTVVGGRLSGVGSGLALGGGLSFLSNQYGMACDSFRELKVVLPSGDIVTASETSNPDLFFGLRGGGGNAYGIVTKYTVQSRPVGNFYAGVIVYLFDWKDDVLNGTRDFIAYNTDPKACIFVVYETFSTPDLYLDLDEAIILYMVYDGEDPGDAFSNFTRIPHLIDTRSIKTYPEAADMPIPYVSKLSRADNMFRLSAYHISDENLRTPFEEWRSWALKNKGKYVGTQINLYPVPLSLTDASKAQGGDAMQLPDGPWFWFNYVLTTPPGISNSTYQAIQKDFRDLVEATPSAPDLPFFLNEAAKDQNALATFSSYSELQQIKKKYDPDNFFAEMTGGWSFA